jgi:PLP dependent protein
MSISQNLLQTKAIIPENVTLVAVSKTKPVADLMKVKN